MAEKSPKNLFTQPEPAARRWVAALSGKFGDWAEQKAAAQDIRRRARENGRNNLPLSGDAEPDVVQQQIVDGFYSGADSLYQALWNRLRGAHDLIVDRIPKPLEPDPIKALARIEIVGIRDRAKDELVALYHDEREAWKDLKLFKGENALARSAVYPKPRPPMLVVSAILSALVVESALNGLIFRDVSPSYTVGGILQAVAFSLVNVFLGYFALGFAAARYATHHDRWKRQMGWSGIGFIIFLGLLWNLYVAHWREAAAESFAKIASDLARAATQPGVQLPDVAYMIVDAGEHLLKHGLGLTSWSAIVLLVLGLMIFTALAVEGYHGWDDTYPGYGRVDRAHKDARIAYERRVGDLRTAINSALDAVKQDVSGRLQADETRVAEALEIESEAQQAEREARDSVTDLARSCLQNLRDYREANSYVRTTNPPAYFAQFPQLESDLPENDQISKRLEEAQAALISNREAKRTFDNTLGEWAREEAGNLAVFLNQVREEATFRADHERKGGLYIVEGHLGEASSRP